MADTYNSPSLNKTVRSGATGNLSVATASITGNGSGSTIAIGDTVNFIRLPAFTRVHGVKLCVGTATASLTAEVGYAPDGGTAKPAAFISSGTDASAVTPVRDNTGAPVDLTVGSTITLTTAGAAVAATTVVTLVVTYEYLGTP
ncbi:MAG TPA: hypothetical protein VFQ88_12905 [Nevskiaceae bacterium]|nr:hypothetical protein [Nevskiaceae bacterium]